MKLAVLGINLLLPLTLFAAEPTSTQVVTSPYWNQDQSSVKDKAVADIVKEVPVATASAVAAHYNYLQSNSDLSRASNKIQADFYSSSEYTAAADAVKQAYINYNQLRDKAIVSVHNTDQYRAVTDFRKDLNDQLLNEHGRKNPVMEKIVAIAELKQSSIAPFRTKEVNLLSKDKDVADARDKLMKANDKLAKLEKDFKVKVRDNPELASLIEKRSESRTQFLVSSAYLQQVREARNIIIKYAEPYQSNYSPYGFGYGLGYGSDFGYGGGYGGRFYGR